MFFYTPSRSEPCGAVEDPQVAAGAGGSTPALCGA